MNQEETNKTPREITADDLERYRDHYYLTAGRLLDFIQEKMAEGAITRDSLVLSQRVEDLYFEKNDWGVVKKESDHYHYCLEHNKRIDEGDYLNKEEYPEIKGDEPFLKKVPENEMEASKDQYHPVWCPVIYNDDDNLYLDLHY